MWYSLGLVCGGPFDQANAELQRAYRLDPLSIVIDMNLGFFLWGERQPRKAVERLNKTLDLEPNFAAAYLTRGLAYAQLGKLKETTAAFETGIRLDNSPRTLALYGNSLALLGQRDKALGLLAELNDRSRREYVSPWCRAVVYAGLGEKDLAFKWLDLAFQERSTDLLSLKFAPLYDRLLPDPRFDSLVRRVGFWSDAKGAKD